MLRELEQVPASNSASAKLLLTVEEAARAMSLGRTMMYQLVRGREILSIKVGRTRRIPASALHEFVKRMSEAEKGV